MKYKKSFGLEVFLLFLLLSLFCISFLSIRYNKQHINENKPLISQPDDFYEENDFKSMNYSLSYDNGRWLRYVNGKGVQNDDDWFQITILPGYERLIIFLIFSHDDGNINIEVCDITGSTIIGGYSTTDNEFINCTLFPGDYCIRIHGPNMGTFYDLIWERLPTGPIDDYYEFNDDFTSAFYIWQNEWLSFIGKSNGEPFVLGCLDQSDDDFYEIYINYGHERSVIELISPNMLGDVDFEIYNASYDFVTASYINMEHEIFVFTFSSTGPYYIRVFGDNDNSVYDLYFGFYDDAYEENDYEYDAYYLSSYAASWLSSIEGMGIQSDDDWYEVYLDPGELRIYAQLTYIHEPGKNIDMEIWYYDYGFTLLAGSYDQDNDEHIDEIAPWSGTYYIKIFGDNAGNEYDLWWEDRISHGPGYDDNYEMNNYPDSAYDIGEDEQSWLRHGLGIQADEDWFMIYMTPGFDRLIVNLTFHHSEGDIDIEVRDKENNLIIEGLSASDNEYINVILPSYGRYYLKIFGDDAGNEYDLWWDDVRSTEADDRYEPNDNYGSAFSLSEYKNTWLSEIDGYGVNLNDDWYEFYVKFDSATLVVFLNYSFREGSIFLELHGSGPTMLIRSSTFRDHEIITYEIQTNGTYYLRVYGSNKGNVYDLIWHFEGEDEGYWEIPGYDVLILIGSVFGISTIIIITRKKK